MTWRKLFHLLLPLSEFAICFSCICFNMYCVSINNQEIIHTLITAGGGYILVFCFLSNALHWAYLTNQLENRKFPVMPIVLIILFFVGIPVLLDILITSFHLHHNINSLKIIHFIELVYTVLLNFGVGAVMVYCWRDLHRKLKDFTKLLTIDKLSKRITLQMILYVSFFVLRAFFLLIVGILGQVYPERHLTATSSLFFVSGVVGDIPLALVMLYFLEHKKPVTEEQEAGGGGGALTLSSSSISSSSSDFSSSSSPSTYTPLYDSFSKYSTSPSSSSSFSSPSSSSSYYEKKQSLPDQKDQKAALGHYQTTDDREDEGEMRENDASVPIYPHYLSESTHVVDLNSDECGSYVQSTPYFFSPMEQDNQLGVTPLVGSYVSDGGYL